MNDLYNTIDKKEQALLKNINYTVKDSFWYDNPMVLLNFNRLDEFFPSRDMTLEEQLNSFVRLAFYLSLGIVCYTSNINYIYLFILTLIFTYLIYYYSNKDNTETFESNYTKKIVTPTQDNPFMNILPNEYIDNPNREAISKMNCNVNPNLDKLITKEFNYNLYRDSSDIYGRNTSQRQFYTMPVTTIPNEQGKFANWLYKTDTCKSGDMDECVKNVDNRLDLGMVSL